MSDTALESGFPATGMGLPATPDPSLDPYLDALQQCFERFGVRRTKVTDVAEAVGVSRVTVYRQVGAVDEAARLLIARELHRLLLSVAPRLPLVASTRDLAVLLADVVADVRAHPLLVAVLRDESDLVGGFVVRELAVVLDRLLELGQPLLANVPGPAPAIHTAAEVLARMFVTLVLAPHDDPARLLLAVLDGILVDVSAPLSSETA